MIINGVNAAKLIGEFWEAGIVDKYHNFDYNNQVTNLVIDFTEGTDMDLVQQIIDTHNPTPIPQPLSETEKIRLEMARSNAEMFEMMVSMMGGAM